MIPDDPTVDVASYKFYNWTTSASIEMYRTIIPGRFTIKATVSNGTDTAILEKRYELPGANLADYHHSSTNIQMYPDPTDRYKGTIVYEDTEGLWDGYYDMWQHKFECSYEIDESTKTITTALSKAGTYNETQIKDRYKQYKLATIAAIEKMYRGDLWGSWDRKYAGGVYSGYNDNIMVEKLKEGVFRNWLYKQKQQGNTVTKNSYDELSNDEKVEALALIADDLTRDFSPYFDYSQLTRDQIKQELIRLKNDIDSFVNERFNYVFKPRKYIYNDNSGHLEFTAQYQDEYPWYAQNGNWTDREEGAYDGDYVEFRIYDDRRMVFIELRKNGTYENLGWLAPINNWTELAVNHEDGKESHLWLSFDEVTGKLKVYGTCHDYERYYENGIGGYRLKGTYTLGSQESPLELDFKPSTIHMTNKPSLPD